MNVLEEDGGHRDADEPRILLTAALTLEYFRQTARKLKTSGIFSGSAELDCKGFMRA